LKEGIFLRDGKPKMNLNNPAEEIQGEKNSWGLGRKKWVEKDISSNGGVIKDSCIGWEGEEGPLLGKEVDLAIGGRNARKNWSLQGVYPVEGVNGRKFTWP